MSGRDHTATASAGHRLGLDIGGTKTLAVLLDPAGAVLATRCRPTLSGSAGVVHTAVETVGALVGETA